MILETHSKHRADALQSPIHAALESGRYPPWLVELVTDTNESARTVTQHETWFRFSDGSISRKEHHALLMGFWPLFERFPKFLALNLLKCDYGSDSVRNAVRDWLKENREQFNGEPPLNYMLSGEFEKLLMVRNYTEWLTSR